MADVEITYLTRQQTTVRLRKGHVLHMENTELGRKWWFESPHADVSPETVAKIRGAKAAAYVLEPQMDNLFSDMGDENSQTWRYERKSKTSIEDLK